VLVLYSIWRRKLFRRHLEQGRRRLKGFRFFSSVFFGCSWFCKGDDLYMYARQQLLRPLVRPVDWGKEIAKPEAEFMNLQLRRDFWA
jgi:hypothetical protein